MSRDGSGNYSLPQAPFVPNTVISSTSVNSNFSDIATALTQSFSRDGQTQATGNWNLNNNRIGSLGTPVFATDAVTKAYVDSASMWELIADTAATATANIDFTWNAGDYRALQVFVCGVVPASASASIQLGVQMRRAGTFIATGYANVSLSGGPSSGNTYNNGGTLTYARLTVGGQNAALNPVSGNLTVDPGATSLEPWIGGVMRSTGDGALGRLVHTVSGSLTSTGSIDGLRFFWDGAVNFQATGRIVVLGMKSAAAILNAISLTELAAYDLPFDFGEGAPIGTEPGNTLSIQVPRAIVIPADFVGSVGRAGTNPTGTATFTVALDGGTIGTMTISALGVVTFTSSTPGVNVNVAAGSVVSISAPVPANATLAAVTATLACQRSL
jgi:hypothetical protein